MLRETKISYTKSNKGRKNPMVYKVYPMITCKLSLDKGTFTYRNYYGEKILVPVYAWLVKGEGEPLLIDAGCTAKEAAILSPAFVGEDVTPIENSLQKAGFSMSDIKTIILTHMHIDHFLNARNFPNSKIIVQEEELNFARNPHPVFSKSFNRNWYKGLNFETVNGDAEIFPGVNVIFTPGHTPGTQSISISTARGKVLIAGFCSLEENFENNIVPGIHTDIFKAYDNLLRVKEFGGTLIPLHSMKYIDIDCIL